MFKHTFGASSPRLNAVAIAAAALIALYAHPASAQSQPVQLPQGGTFQRGDGAITTNGASTQINTTSAPGKVSVINWGGGFNVGAGGKVTFNNGTGATSLNSINVDPTGKASSINGAINGTGPGMNILVVNPNGVSLGNGASINTTGTFSAVAGNVDPASIAPGAAGTVNIVLGNAPIIVNSAVAGQSTAQGKIEVGPDKAIAMGASGPSTLPAVLGSADITIGGTGAVTGSGSVAAGGESYRLNTAGSLTFTNASIAANKDIAITGKEVRMSGTSINAAAEGASVKLGGGARGKDASIANAQITNVDAGSSITTGANSSVVVWGDKANFEGTIVNPGGNAEISGKQLFYSGTTDLRGATKTGTLLFDPDDLIIDVAGGAYTPQIFGSTGPSTISGAAISTAMQTASVALEANNSITVQDAITSATPGSNLSMSTGGLLSIGAKINIQGNFDGKVGALSAVGATAAPEVRMTPGGAIETNGGNIRLTTETTPGSTFNAVAGTAAVNGVNYQGSLLNAGGGNVEVALGYMAANGLDIKTRDTGKIDVTLTQYGFDLGYQTPSTTPGVTNISDGGVWSSERGNINLYSSWSSSLAGTTIKTYAGSGQTGGNIVIASGRNLYANPDATGTKPMQVLAVGATDAAKTGDVYYGAATYLGSYAYGATIYSGPQNDPNGTAGALSVQPGSITLGPGGYVGNITRFYDSQVSNRVSWGTNDKSAPLSINGFNITSVPSGGATAFGPEPTNGGFFAEGNWYPAGAVPGLGKPATFMSTRPENYSYTPLVSSGDMTLQYIAYGAISGVDSGGKLDMSHNFIFPTGAGVNWSNLKSTGDMNLVVNTQPNTTIGYANSGGKLSISTYYGVKIADELTAAGGISLWNADVTGNPAYAIRFLPGAKAISTATSGESIALAAFNFATGFDFGGQPLPIIAPGGRWAYYFTDPSGISADPLFGPAKTFHRYNCSYGGAPGACANTDAPAIPASGTAYLYAYSPILTINTPTFATTYGTGPDYRANSTFSGYIAADAGIDAVTGTMAVTGGTYSTSGNLRAGTQSVTYGSGLASQLGYKFTGPQFTVNVAQKEITQSSGITSADKTYDGTTAASVNTSGAVFTGAAAADILTASATGAFVNKNAGTNKTVTLSGLNLAGTDSNNYTLAATGNQATTLATITPKVVTVDSGLTLDDKVYDGTTQAIANSSAGVISGVLAADVGSVAVGVVAGNYSDKLVGTTKSATLSNFALSGAEAGNYVVDAAGSQQSATGNITPKTLTVTSVNNANKTYDGTTVAAGVAVLSGVVTGDAVTGDTSGNFDTKNVGVNKTITYGGFTLSNSDASNYVLASSGNAASGVGQITPKSITIDSGLLVNKVYDGSTAVTANGSAAVFTGLIGGDVVAATGITGSFVDKNVGSGKTATFSTYGLSGVDGGNYVVDAAGSQLSALGDITPKTVAISSGLTVGKVYDGSIAVVANGASAVIAGLVSGDAVAATASGSFADKNVGTSKTATFSSYGLSGSDSSNYVLDTAASQASAVGSITPKTIQISSGLTADKTYDGSATAIINGTAAVIAGKVAGDNLVATASGNFVDKNAGISKTVAVTGYGVSGTDAGNYLVDSTGNQSTIVATIAPKGVSVGGGSITGVNKVFDGNTAAKIAVTGATVTGKIAGDALLVNASGAFDNQNVGNNKSVVFGSYGLTGADAANYTVVTSTPPFPGTTASITPTTPPVVPVVSVTPTAFPAEALPRTPGQSSVFGGWVVNSQSGQSGVALTSPEFGTAGGLVMSSGPLTSTGGGTARVELCISNALAFGTRPSDAVKQCSAVVTPKPTR